MTMMMTNVFPGFSLYFSAAAFVCIYIYVRFFFVCECVLLANITYTQASKQFFYGREDDDATPQYRAHTHTHTNINAVGFSVGSCSAAGSAAVAVIKKNVKVEKLGCVCFAFSAREMRREKRRDRRKERMSNPSFQ